MIPIKRTPSNSGPQTFGQSSNVWRHVDLVHHPNLQPPQQFSPCAIGIDGSVIDNILLTSRHERGEDLKTKQLEKLTGEGGNQHSPAPLNSPFLQSLPSAVSVPDLHQFASLRAQLGRIKPLAISISASPLVSTRLRTANGNSADIMKRLQALGTHLLTPEHLIAPNSSVSHNTESLSSRTSLNQVSGAVKDTSISLAATGAPIVSATVPLVSTAVNGVLVLDAENIRNAFNSQATRLSYGCSVALELFNGHLLTVGSPDGKVRVQSLEKLQMPQAKGYKERVIVKLVNLEDVLSADSIRYGDSVWLQLSVGTGDVSWEQDGVLGAKVREAPQLKALGSRDNESIRNDVQTPAAVGFPVPVTAYLPKSRDDGDLQVDDAQFRMRNKTAKVLGKWTIRSAVYKHRNQKDNFVYNNDEGYLEQDWFYLGADSNADVAVLRQLPSTVIGKDIKPGDYVVERRGAWKFHLLDLSGEGAGLSLAQQQMERLLLRAKAQLKQSKRMRAGQTKSYGPHLRGGSGFTVQLRAQVAASTRQLESRCADQQERRLEHIHRHITNKAQSMNVALGLEKATALTRSSSNRPNRNARAMSTKQDNDLVAVGRCEQKSELRYSASMERNRVDKTWPILDNSGAGYLKHSFVLESSDVAASCALCHSSSISYNLCCQNRDIIQKLEQECLDEARARQNHRKSILLLGSKRATYSKASRIAKSTDTTKTRGTVAVESTGCLDEPEALCATSNTTPLTVTRINAHNPKGRSFRLFAKEDAAMVNLIKYKEKEAGRTEHEQSQDATTLTPLAARFRDRFKHVGIFVQMHKLKQQGQEEENSGQIQKVFTSLSTAEITDEREHD